MPPYKKMYFHLFNAITDALRALEKGAEPGAVRILIDAQKWGENAYVEAADRKENHHPESSKGSKAYSSLRPSE